MQNSFLKWVMNCHELKACFSAMGVRRQLVIRICKMTFHGFLCFVESSFGLYYSKQSISSFFDFFLVLFSGWNRKERLWKCSKHDELQEAIFHQKTTFPHSYVSYFHSYTLDKLSFFSPFPFFHHSSCFQNPIPLWRKSHHVVQLSFYSMCIMPPELFGTVVPHEAFFMNPKD